MKKGFGHFEYKGGKALGPDDPIVTGWFHRRDRSFTITREVAYIDRHGNRWEVFSGDTNNGATIPRILPRIWTPYTERFRDAAAFHDPYCVNKVRGQKMTHEMYWGILRCTGVNPITAYMQWLAISAWCWWTWPEWKQ